LQVLRQILGPAFSHLTDEELADAAAAAATAGTTPLPAAPESSLLAQLKVWNAEERVCVLYYSKSTLCLLCQRAVCRRLAGAELCWRCVHISYEHKH